ncbi:MAG: hypothetical protein H0Z33_00055 [Bacillaceae bacterium]|nr:hypothetical protein [Bacillaceae bacterium]
MYSLLYFFHISGLVIWLGSLIALGFLLMILKGRLVAGDNPFVASTLNLIKWLSNPGALVVLITGVMMLVQMGMAGGDKPFWLSFMEQAGGMVILLSIILLTLLSRRIMKRLTGGKSSSLPSLTGYLTVIGLTVLMSLSVVLVVSFKWA